MKLFGKELLLLFLVEKSNILAYSVGYRREEALEHLKKVASFHRLGGRIVEDKKLSEKFENFINKYLSSGKIPFKIDLTPYRYREVYETLLGIERGKTITYGRLASLVGYSVRAVVQALIHNPFIFFIPCHRVVRAKGDIGGYTPLGREFKRKLLALELNTKDHP